MYTELFQGEDGWRWRLKGDNHETLASSEVYFSKSDAKRTCDLVQQSLIPDDVVPDPIAEAAATVGVQAWQQLQADSDVYVQERIWPCACTETLCEQPGQILECCMAHGWEPEMTLNASQDENREIG